MWVDKMTGSVHTRFDKNTSSVHEWADKRTCSILEKRLEEVLRKAHLGDLWFRFLCNGYILLMVIL